jgi:hypothetical protein
MMMTVMVTMVTMMVTVMMVTMVTAAGCVSGDKPEVFVDYPGIVKLLLEKGVDPELRVKGQTPAEYHREIAENLKVRLLVSTAL